MQTAAPLLIALGLLVAALGWWLLSRSRAAAPRSPPEITDPAGSVRVAELWLELALELCRVDGAIHDREIAALERGLVEGPPGCTPEQATRAVHDALRKPIGPSRVAPLLAELDRLADPRHRAAVLAALGEVAGADGEISSDERRLLDRARSVLGSR